MTGDDGAGLEVTLHVSGTIEKLNVSYARIRRSPSRTLWPAGDRATPASYKGIAGPRRSIRRRWDRPGRARCSARRSPVPSPDACSGSSGERLKIDPQITGVTTSNAAARITLEQQLSSNLSFTSVTDLSRGQAQILRVNGICQTWSAVASGRERMFGIDFLYKKQFK